MRTYWVSRSAAPRPEAALTERRDEPGTRRGHSVEPGLLTDFVAAFAALGVPEPDARLAADSLVTTDLWDHPSHAVRRLSWYSTASAPA